MDKKLTNLIGTSKEFFDKLVQGGEIKLRNAYLIPVIKAGDEMALTSVLLAAIRLIKEFKNLMFSDIKMMKGGQIFVYTEIVFPTFPDSRIDGLILVVKNGIIKDATIFEMKNGNNELESEQINKYIEITKKYNIPRIVTVSNQYVSEPTQSPLNLKLPKTLSMYHLSWSYLLTIAHILLFDNDINIEDQDQIEIMKEVLNYFENEKAGICGFNQMKPGWKEILEQINSGKRLKISDPNLDDTVSSWQQEEKDMALILSKKLGVFITSGNSKYKNNLKARIENDKKMLIDKKELVSILKVKGAVSDIKIRALFEKRTIEMSVSLKIPEDKTLKGQVSWLKKQLEICKKKGLEAFEEIDNEAVVEVAIKNSSVLDRYYIYNLDNIAEDFKNKEIRDFKIIDIKDFGKSFSNRRKFVETIEKMLIDFYSGIVQFLKNWEKPAPRIVTKNIEEKNENICKTEKAVEVNSF